MAFGCVFTPNIAITYLIDCYPAYASDVVVAVNVVKNVITFAFLYTAVDWIATAGWIQVYMIMFMLVTLSTLLAIPLYFYGARLRNSRWNGRFIESHGDAY